MDRHFYDAPKCFLLAAEVLDTKCALSNAERLLRERDRAGVSVALREVAKRGAKLARLCPDAARSARKLRDEAVEISKIARVTPKNPVSESRLSVQIGHLYAHLQEVYDSSKRRCRVLRVSRTAP
jgi:hypothetical protein